MTKDEPVRSHKKGKPTLKSTSLVLLQGTFLRFKDESVKVTSYSTVTLLARFRG
jgi:hypothetical protein